MPELPSIWIIGLNLIWFTFLGLGLFFMQIICYYVNCECLEYLRIFILWFFFNPLRLSSFLIVSTRVKLCIDFSLLYAEVWYYYWHKIYFISLVNMSVNTATCLIWFSTILFSLCIFNVGLWDKVFSTVFN